jgi:hypothetical protein
MEDRPSATAAVRAAHVQLEKLEKALTQGAREQLRLERAIVKEQARSEQLATALRGLAMELESGERCWCSVATGVGEEHASFCLNARAALAQQ